MEELILETLQAVTFSRTCGRVTRRLDALRMGRCGRIRGLMQFSSSSHLRDFLVDALKDQAQSPEPPATIIEE